MSLQSKGSAEKAYQQSVASDGHYFLDKELKLPSTSWIKSLINTFKAPFAGVYHGVGTASKFFVISLIADPEYQRELACVLADTPTFFRSTVTLLLTMPWMYGKKVQSLALPFFIVCFSLFASL
jgi:hypothetical protein